MAQLVAGDLVLSSPTEATRVVVNKKHSDAPPAPMTVLEHEHGELILTPDHVLKVDGRFVPAREAAVGAMLEPASKITKVYLVTRRPINLITSDGKILAAGRTGAPVIASVYPEWIAPFILASSLYPLPYSFGSAASYLLPERAQAFFDLQLDASSKALLRTSRLLPRVEDVAAAFPTPVKLALLLCLDVAVTAWFTVWALCSLKGLAALLALAAAAKARRALKA